MGKFIDLTGQKFGRLTVIKRTENKGHNTMWLCKCDCGNEKTIQSSDLKNGKVISCGCYRNSKNITHGKSHTSIHNIWGLMKRRCYNKNDKSYSSYGGRGIKVCSEWLNNFQAFYDWAMSSGYQDNLTLDRIDNSGNYEPSNCRWVSMKTQANNKRNSRYISYNGETLTVSQWAERLNITYQTLWYRLNNWKLEDVFSNPVNTHKGADR